MDVLSFPMMTKSSARLAAVLAALISGLQAAAAAAGDLASAEQNALVKKYCAVCHTDRAANGGLSLEHYNASRPDPQLAAMILSKLRNGAMGAAGLGVPDPDTQAAWVATTVRQSAGADNWTVNRSEPSASHASIVTSSIVRTLPLRTGQTNAPVYRLTLACNAATHEGTILLTWSPEPQTNRTFSVSADGQPGIPHELTGQEKMGNGSSGVSGRASAMLHVGQPAKSLTVSNLFPAETVVFPIDALDQQARQELTACSAIR